MQRRDQFDRDLCGDPFGAEVNQFHGVVELFGTLGGFLREGQPELLGDAVVLVQRPTARIEGRDEVRTCFTKQRHCKGGLANPVLIGRKFVRDFAHNVSGGFKRAVRVAGGDPHGDKRRVAVEHPHRELGHAFLHGFGTDPSLLEGELQPRKILDRHTNLLR